MSFFGLEHIRRSASTTTTGLKGLSKNFLHGAQCRACPLNNAPVRHPKMEPTGANKPIIYVIGEAPGDVEDRLGEQFVGKSGQVLRFRIPDDVLPSIRWNNCVRTRPPGNRNPTVVEIECCKPSIVRDIERTKPQALFGFGNVPLQWVLDQSGIMGWRGRRIPVKIGSHTCWFYPMVHPSYVLRSRKFTPKTKKEYGSEIEFAFALDLKNAIREVKKGLPKPIVCSPDDALHGIKWISKAGKYSISEIKNFLDATRYDKYIGIDYETSKLRPYEGGAKILTVAISGEHGTLAFPIDHSQTPFTKSERDQIVKLYVNFLRRAKGYKIVHNLAFELEWTGFFFGRDLIRAGKWACTQAQSYIFDERRGGSPGPHSLEFLCLQYFGINVKNLGGVLARELDKVDLDKVLRYNGLDSKFHRKLYLAQRPKLKSEDLIGVYDHHIRRIQTLVLTQLEGIPVDQKVVNKFLKYYSKRLRKVERRIRRLKVAKRFKKLTSYSFRPSANEDIKIVCRDILREQQKGSKYSVDENFLSKVKHPIARQTLKWRKTNKLISTYIKPFQAGVSPHVYTGSVIHPVFATMRTRTWRSSAQDPNVQNQPKRDYAARKLRKQIKPGTGEVIVSFDYAGIQARNVAMESKDEALIRAFWDRYDIHGDWCERIFRAYPKWVPGGKRELKDNFKKYRDRAKNEFVFPSFFGAYYTSVGGYLGIPVDVAEILQDQFWDMFPDVKGWHEELKRGYYKNGYVTGLSGFRRHAPITQNELINAPIQADEAIIVFDSMIRLSELDCERYQAALMVHDDLTFIMPKKQVDSRSEVIIREMLNCPFDWAQVVPLGVEMNIGEDWGSMKEVGEYYSDEKWVKRYKKDVRNR